MDKLMLAGHIADAASFFDTASCAIPVEQQEAIDHIERLHDAAQILAGDRVGEIYTPDDGNFVEGKHYSREIAFGDIKLPLDLTHWRYADGSVWLVMTIKDGPFALHLDPTPTQCRELAAALKQLAEDAERSAVQGKREQDQTISVQQAAGQCVACEAN